MLQRGRKSQASLSVVPAGIPKRPDPPKDLGKEEQIEWKAIVNRMPVDWFREEQFPLLSQLCRHIVLGRDVSDRVKAFLRPKMDTAQIRDYSRLLNMMTKQTKTIATLSTKLRLTNQSKYYASKAFTKIRKASANKPWERKSA